MIFHNYVSLAEGKSMDTDKSQYPLGSGFQDITPNHFLGFACLAEGKVESGIRPTRTAGKVRFVDLPQFDLFLR